MARPARRLTKADLDKLRTKAQADPTFAAYFSDAAQAGLYAWARRGKVTFVFDYRPPAGGARRRMLLDTYGGGITLDGARRIAAELRTKVVGGRDPHAEREQAAREATTFGEIARAYLDDLRQRAETGARRGKRSGYASHRQLLERYVLPKLGDRRILDVTADDVKRLHRAMKATPAAANRMLTVISAVYGFADGAELVPARYNPTRHVAKLEERGERRALTTEELKRLGEAMHQAEQGGTIAAPPLLALRLLALTGFRRGEVLGHGASARRGNREGLRWGDVDLGRGLVHLPATKTGRQTRVIGRATVELLKAAGPAGASPDDPICPGEVVGAPYIGIDKVRRRLYRAAGLDGLPGVDLHSLRHSFATTAAHLADGRYAGLVSALLGHGHTSRAVTSRYVSGDPEALRPAADAVAGAIAAALGIGRSAKVLPMRRRGRQA